MINAGTVGAYLELDISQFSDNLLTAGQMLDSFRREHDDDFNGSGGLRQSLLTGLTSGLLSAGLALSDFVRQFGSASDSLRSDAELTGGAIGSIGEHIHDATEAAERMYSDSVKSAAEAVAGAVHDITDALDENAGSWENLSQMQGTCGEQITQSAVSSANTVCSAFGQVPGKTQGFMLDSWVGMKSELAAGKPQLVSAAKSDGDGILNGVDNALGSSSPSGGMRALGSRAIGLLCTGMEDKRENARSSVKGIMDNMLAAAGSVSFTGIGGNVVSGILRGINEKAPSLMVRATSLAAGIAETIRTALHVNSPSKVMIPMGQAVAEGMEVGLIRGAGSLYRTASAISLETADALGDISLPSQGYSALSPAGDRIDRLERILEAVEKLADSPTTMEIDGRSFGRLVREQVR